MVPFMIGRSYAIPPTAPSASGVEACAEAAQSASRRYHTVSWRAVRQFVLIRDRYMCQLRLSGCTGTPTPWIISSKQREEDQTIHRT